MRRIIAFFAVGFLCLTSTASAYDYDGWTSFPNMNYVRTLVEGANIVYVATTGGIRRYDRLAGHWLAPLTTLNGLPADDVQRMAFDAKTGDLWFETAAGSGRWLSNLQTVIRGGAPPAGIYQPHVKPDIPPVFPPFGYYVDPTHIIGPRQNYAVTDILIDDWHNLWIATWGLGVGHSNLSTDRQLQFLTSGPLEQNVTAIAKDGNTLWLGGADTFGEPSRGITHYHLNTGVWDYFEAGRTMGLDDPQIVVILPDRANVWFGTHSGLMRYERKSNRWLAYRDTRSWGRVTGLARDGNVLWIGSDNGLGLLDVRADSLDHVSGSERAVISSLIAGPDALWAGTDVGLYRCRRGDRTWRAVTDPNGWAKRSVRALAVYDSTLWIATGSPGGLLRYAPSDTTWQAFPLSEINGSRQIDLAADSTRVWVGTDAGAFLLDVPRQLWTHYTHFNGLIHSNVQAVLRDGNDIWFGTPAGLSRFRWDSQLFDKK